ncbi:hypothetical protein ACI6Q2_23140 [Chitinophagaceae bacterium LWZ2-11]
MKNKVNYFFAIYLALCGIACLILFINSYGLLGIMASLFPAVFTMLIMLFFIVVDLRNILNINSKTNNKLLVISFLIQSFQIIILGIKFVNYFGPYFGIGITNEQDVLFQFKFRSFDYLFRNGYEKGNNEISLMFNLIPLFVAVRHVPAGMSNFR